MTSENDVANATFQRHASVLSASLGPDDIALLDGARESYFGLEGPAGRIWQLLEQPATLDSICAALVAEYDVEPARCRQETAALLADLATRSLVVRQPAR